MEQIIKKAFCLGINNYNPEIWGDANLKGCINDRNFYYNVFKNLGFETSVLEESITVAQFDGLIKSLQGLKGIVAIMYSGHGTYYDKPITANATERMTGICLADDVYWDAQFRNALSTLDKDLQIIWISDSCYSEDNFKNIESICTHECHPKFSKLPKTLESHVVNIETKGKAKLQCSIISFSASNKWQPGFDVVIDGVPMGAFSGCFKRVYDKYHKDNLTYYETWKRIVKEIKKEGFPQNPQLQATIKKPANPKDLVVKTLFT